MNILIISLSGAGDVLMSTPLIRELRLSYPRARIDVLVMQGRATKDLFKDNKDVDKVIYFNFMEEGFLKSLIFCNKLSKQKYNLSITTYPQARLHYSVVSWLIHAKKRIGFNYETQRLRLNNLLFTHKIEEDFSLHVVENNLRVLKVLKKERRVEKPKLIFNLSKDDRNFASDFFEKNKIKKAVIIHPGSGTTKNFILKRWHKKRFAELCREIWKKEKEKIILVGGPDEEMLKREIIIKSGLKEGEEIFNLSGNINKTAAIINKSKLVVSNDTIIGHIAAAVDSKVVSIFGPTSWENTSPYTDKKVIVCKRANIKPWKHGRKGITKKQASSLYNIQVKDVYEAFNRIKEVK